ICFFFIFFIYCSFFVYSLLLTFLLSFFFLLLFLDFFSSLFFFLLSILSYLLSDLDSVSSFDLFSSLLLHAVNTRKNRSEEHTSELQSRFDLVCRLLLEKKKYKNISEYSIHYT